MPHAGVAKKIHGSRQIIADTIIAGILHATQTAMLFGRATSGAGAGEEITLGGALSNAGGVLTDGVYSGSFSGVGTATTTFTVTIGPTLGSAAYRVNVTPTAALSAALFYITNKTTTSFDVVFLAGLTGTVTFDWAVHS